MADSAPLADAVISAGALRSTTGANGEATLVLPVGEWTITVEKTGFLKQTVKVTVVTGTNALLAVTLVPTPVVTEDVIVTATRSDKRLQDEPLRVEVLGREEIEEKLLMTPGDIAMMLNETAGLRVQVTSPSLGAASLRIQGLRGRYTQLLSDGLPLYGGQSGLIGLLQIPPMDLGQVEIIKGAASSLFGSSALGGVINLVSRQPPEDAEHELLFNRTTQRGTDAMLWLSGPVNDRWGCTVLTGLDHQQQNDLDDDGWVDVAGFTRVIARPRLFWNNQQGKSAFLTGGFTAEDRSGGTLAGFTVPDGSPFPEALSTRRADAGVVTRLTIGRRVLGIRGAFMAQRHTHEFGDVIELDAHHTAFAEVSLTGINGPHTWVIWRRGTDRLVPIEVRASIRLHVRRAVAVHPGRFHDHGILRGFGQCAARRPQPVWLLPQSARLRAVSVRIGLDRTRVGWWRLLRPDAAHRGNRSGWAVEAGVGGSVRGRARLDVLGRRQPRDRAGRGQRDVIRLTRDGCPRHATGRRNVDWI